MREINEQVATVKGEVRDNNTRSIRCSDEDYETVAKFLKTSGRNWSFLINVLAREIRQKGWIELHSVLKRVLLEESETKEPDRVVDF